MTKIISKKNNLLREKPKLPISNKISKNKNKTQTKNTDKLEKIGLIEYPFSEEFTKVSRDKYLINYKGRDFNLCIVVKFCSEYKLSYTEEDVRVVSILPGTTLIIKYFWCVI